MSLMRPDYGHKSHDTLQFDRSRHVLHSFIQQLDDRLSHHLALSHDPKMPRTRPCSHQSAAGCRPIAAVAVAAEAGSRPSTSSVRLSLPYSLSVLVN